MTRAGFRAALAAALMLMALTFPVSAVADAPAVLTRNASLYAKPSTASRQVFKLTRGQSLILRATNGAWSKVVYQGKTVYMARKSIAKQSANLAYAAEDLKLFKKCDTSADAYCSVKAGSSMYVLDTEGNWAKALYQGYTGFARRDELSGKKPSPTPKPTPTPTLKPTVKPTATPTPTPEPEAAYAKVKTRLYKRAKASGKAVVLPKGAEVVRYYFKNKTWAKVRYGEKTGYMVIRHLTKIPLATPTPKPTPTPTPMPTPKPTPTPKPAATPVPSAYKPLKPGDSGSAVKSMQTRLKALGWYSGSIGGNYKTLTTQAVTRFQDAIGLTATGIATVETLEKLYAADAPTYGSTFESTATPATGKAVEMDWWTSDIQQIFFRGRIVVVTDVRTGISWREARLGGNKHADCEPLTAKDTAALKAAYGGTWSWDRRPVWVSIAGARYAASMNGRPHGDGPRDNDFPGHHCIHFTNSRTHTGNRLDARHQAAIKEALAAG